MKLITIALILLTISSCKKELDTETPTSQGINQGYFVIGSQKFFDDFNIDLHRYKAYSVDSTRLIHSFNLDSSFLMDLTINEYRTKESITDSSNFSFGIDINITSQYILTEEYEDYWLRTSNSTKDTNRTTNRNSDLASFPDTIHLMNKNIEIPKLFTVGDTVNWETGNVSRHSEIQLFKYTQQRFFEINEFEEVEISIMDILKSEPRYVVVKYGWYPQNFDYTTDRYNSTSRFGVIELSINGDSTIKIHNVYTQK
jgi:hypothetical protein